MTSSSTPSPYAASPKSSACGLTVVPFGCHTTTSGIGEPDMLWMSTATSTDGPEPIRGGIPVIAPQFGTLLSGPKHGFARNTGFALTTSPDGNEVRGELTYQQFHLLLQVTRDPARSELALELSVENLGAEEETIQLGFHPYFQVSDIAAIAVTGAQGKQLYSVASGDTTTAEGEIRFTESFDQIVRGAKELEILDPGFGRCLTVTSSGDAMVVWNPWEDGAAGMADIHPGGWRNFVCVEPAVLGEDLQGICLPPNQSTRLRMRVTMRPLGADEPSAQ